MCLDKPRTFPLSIKCKTRIVEGKMQKRHRNLSISTRKVRKNIQSKLNKKLKSTLHAHQGLVQRCSPFTAEKWAQQLPILKCTTILELRIPTTQKLGIHLSTEFHHQSDQVKVYNLVVAETVQRSTIPRAETRRTVYLRIDGKEARTESVRYRQQISGSLE